MHTILSLCLCFSALTENMSNGTPWETSRSIFFRQTNLQRHMKTPVAFNRSNKIFAFIVIQLVRNPYISHFSSYEMHRGQREHEVKRISQFQVILLSLLFVILIIHLLHITSPGINMKKMKTDYKKNDWMPKTYFSLRLESPNGFESLEQPDTECAFNFFATFIA